MKAINHIEKLLLNEQQLEMLTDSSQQHLQFFSLSYTIISVEKDQVVIKASQHMPFQEHILEVKQIIETTKNLFGPYLNGKTLIVQPVQFFPSPPDVVNTVWILNEMQRRRISLKALVTLTGIEQSKLSSMINSPRPMSQPMKAMFYYLFMAIKQNPTIVSGF